MVIKYLVKWDVCKINFRSSLTADLMVTQPVGCVSRADCGGIVVSSHKALHSNHKR